MTRFEDTAHCASRAHCKVCRDSGPVGQAWRASLSNTFDIPLVCTRKPVAVVDSDVERQRSICRHCSESINADTVDEVVFCDACKCEAKRVSLRSKCPRDRW